MCYVIFIGAIFFIKYSTGQINVCTDFEINRFRIDEVRKYATIVYFIWRHVTQNGTSYVIGTTTYISDAHWLSLVGVEGVTPLRMMYDWWCHLRLKFWLMMPSDWWCHLIDDALKSLFYLNSQLMIWAENKLWVQQITIGYQTSEKYSMWHHET